MQTLNRFLKDESGATAIEYGLIAALVSVVIIAALAMLGDNLTPRSRRIGTALRHSRSSAHGGLERRACPAPSAARCDGMPGFLE